MVKIVQLRREECLLPDGDKVIIQSLGPRRVPGQVIVGVVGEVDWCGLVSGGLHADQQEVVLAQFVPHGAHHIPWETFIAVWRQETAD